MEVRVIVSIVGNIFGTLIGFYIVTVIIWQDFNIKRGINKWFHRIAKEAFEEVSQSKKV